MVGLNLEISINFFECFSKIGTHSEESDKPASKISSILNKYGKKNIIIVSTVNAVVIVIVIVLAVVLTNTPDEEQTQESPTPPTPIPHLSQGHTTTPTHTTYTAPQFTPSNTSTYDPFAPTFIYLFKQILC